MPRLVTCAALLCGFAHGARSDERQLKSVYEVTVDRHISEIMTLFVRRCTCHCYAAAPAIATPPRRCKFARRPRVRRLRSRASVCGSPRPVALSSASGALPASPPCATLIRTLTVSRRLTAPRWLR